jgi:hypothetical protein
MRILSAIMATVATLTMSLGIAHAAYAPDITISDVEALQPLWQPDRLDLPKPIRFRHGDVSWLPSLAKQAGWPDNSIDQLTQIVLRESGGCPNRRGGDIVDKDCNITGVSEWNHRSDTGLLQINGVNYDTKRNKWAAVCRELNICTQAPLLDAYTNLQAGLVLYRLSGFEPWNPCNWTVCKVSTTSMP